MKQNFGNGWVEMGPSGSSVVYGEPPLAAYEVSGTKPPKAKHKAVKACGDPTGDLAVANVSGGVTVTKYYVYGATLKAGQPVA